MNLNDNGLREKQQFVRRVNDSEGGRAGGWRKYELTEMKDKFCRYLYAASSSAFGIVSIHCEWGN